MRNIFFINNTLKFPYGGRIGSILSRAKMFDKRDGYSVSILTMDFKPNYEEIYVSIIKREKLPQTIQLKNFFAFLAQENVYSVNGDCDFLLPYKSEMMLRENLKAKCERYYTAANRLYLQRTFNDKAKEIECIWVKKDGTIKKFPNIGTLRQYWISELAVSCQNSFFLLDDMGYNKVVTHNIYNDKLRAIATIHSCHYNPPYMPGEGTKNYFYNLFQQPNAFDAIICLTERQKHHIEEEIGHIDNLYVIHHPFADKVSINASDKYINQKTIVMMTRLHPVKQLDHAIRAMQIVSKYDPSIVLKIYGSGEEYDSLNSLIESLGLRETVTLEGYTTDPYEILQSATISLLTSKTEGLPLSILESLALGTPVISYDLNYGPSEMIKDNVNGRLVKNGDIELLARTIIETLADKETLKTMSQNAASPSEDFSEEHIFNCWDNLFYDIESNLSQRRLIDSMMYIDFEKLELRNCEIMFQNDGNIEVTIEAFVDWKSTKNCEPDFYLTHNDMRLLRYLERINVKGELIDTVDTTSAEDLKFHLYKSKLIFSFEISKGDIRKVIKSKELVALRMQYGSNSIKRVLTESFIHDCLFLYMHNLEDDNYLEPFLNELLEDNDYRNINSRLELSSDLKFMYSFQEIDKTLSTMLVAVDGIAIKNTNGLLSGTISLDSPFPAAVKTDLIVKTDEETEIVFPFIVESGFKQQGFKCVYDWHSSIDFRDIKVNAKGLSKQYWKVGLRISWGNRHKKIYKGFKKVATIKFGSTMIFSYFSQKGIC